MKVIGSLLVMQLVGGSALAQSVGISWDDADGPRTRLTACDSNEPSANQYFVTRFTSPIDLPQFVGITVVLDIKVESASVPDWWRLASGECRDSGYDVETATANGLTQRPDPFQGASHTLTGNFSQAGVPNADRIRIMSDIARDTPIPLTAGTEYYAAVHVLRALKTTGNGSCAGCATQACIAVDRVELFQVTGSPGGDVIAFQGSGLWPYPIAAWSSDENTTQCFGIVATHRATWGSLKSLYR